LQGTPEKRREATAELFDREKESGNGWGIPSKRGFIGGSRSQRVKGLKKGERGEKRKKTVRY